jgi:hypothetical protein
LVEPKQCVDGLNVSADCCISRVMIHHELLNEACNDSLVSRLVATWVLDEMLVNEIQVHSLPKSCSSSESDLSLDIFLSTIYPRAARLAWVSAGRKCRLLAPCVTVGGWRNCRYGERKMIWSQLLLVSSALKSCQQFCSRLR